MRDDVGGVPNFAVGIALAVLLLDWAFGRERLDDAGSVGVLPCVAREDVGDGSHPTTPVEIGVGIW